MVFKPSFKCFKNKKINFNQVILKLECLFYLSEYISPYIIFEEQLRLKKKEKWSNNLKNMPFQP